MREKFVDIIIPIYNAYNDLRLCIDSLLKYTDLEKNTLVLINDKSPDERIKPYLDGLASEHIVVIHNQENKGFSGNINIGMAHSDNDVILLNSDTIVTANWVEKIVECAYSNERIATVTPLSNNATLCSVPNFCAENTIPDGMTIDDMAALVEQCSLKLYPEIPVANGFCMFVKRSVIEEIGNFDAETFEKGYGEENDFCYRAIHAGYINVMCDTAFIYHKGTSSFVSEDKLKYMQAHEKVLIQRYPTEMRNTHLHCINNPNRKVFENVKKHLTLSRNRNNVLFLLKSDFREGASDNRGGIQLHAKDLVMSIRDEYNVFVVARDRNYMNLTIYTRDAEFFYRFFLGAPSLYPVFYDRKIKELFDSILDVYRIQKVHVHHTANWSLDLFHSAKDRNIPVFVTLHDFYFVCPNITLLDCDNVLCYKNETKEACAKCLASNCRLSNQIDYLKIWRHKHFEVLQYASKIIAPSESTKDIFSYYYPQLRDNIIVIEHGSDVLEAPLFSGTNITTADNVRAFIDRISINAYNLLYIQGWAYEQDYDMSMAQIWLEISDEAGNTKYHKANTENREDVALGDFRKVKSGISTCLPLTGLSEGNLSIRIILESEKGEYKASDRVCTVNYKSEAPGQNKFRIAFIGGINSVKGGELAYQLIKNSTQDIDFFLIGNIGLEELQLLTQHNYFKTGGYLRENLAELLEAAQIDLICILSICPETFCYTLSEALQYKIPVLVTDIGALGSRVKAMECGWLVSSDANANQVYMKILEIKNNVEEFRNVKEHVSALALRNINDMASDYKLLYASVADDASNTILEVSSDTKRKLEFSSATFTEQQDVQISNYQQSFAELENSLAFRIARKIQCATFPGKRTLKRIVKKIFH